MKLLAIAIAVVVLVVVSFPMTWLAMLFLGNVGLTQVGFWGALPLGIVLTVLAGAGASDRTYFIRG